MTFPSLLMRTLVGLAVLIVSFFGTLFVLDTWNAPKSSSPSPGAGANLVVDSASLFATAAPTEIAKLERVGSAEPSVYRLSGSGPAGEHYIVLSAGSQLEPGVYSFVFEARPGETGHLRVQMWDGARKGIISDIDLNRAAGVLAQGDPAQAKVDVSPKGQWHQVKVVVPLSAPGLTIILQISDREGRASFAPLDESVEIRQARLYREK
jgi:hypothetical protein